jgi:hypothetical protein
MIKTKCQKILTFSFQLLVLYYQLAFFNPGINPAEAISRN